MTKKSGPKQVAIGNNIAQAYGPGANAYVNVYEIARPTPVDEITLSEAELKLSTLPLETVPYPAPLPQGSRIVYSQNPLFVGREQDLLALARALKEGKTAAATGIGGIGKTQLASEFVHRYGQYFAGGTYWLSFADPQAVPAEIVVCGEPGEEGLDFETRIRLVLSRWQSPLPRLLVFDNCEDEELLAQWRPRTGACRVLVTSRRQSWDASLGVDALALGTLSRSESIDLLSKLYPEITDDDASDIAQELGDLPLALHLAGNFLNRYKGEINPQKYLQQLKEGRLLKHTSLEGRGSKLSPTGHELHVARTFELSLNRLNKEKEKDNIALKLLNRAAYFAPGIPIPSNLLFKTLEQEQDEVDPLLRKDGIDRLTELGLIEAGDQDTFVLHRLLAHYVCAANIDDKAQESIETTLLIESNIINNSGYPAALIGWQAHLGYVTDKALLRKDKISANLANNLGFHLQSTGNYIEARPYYEKALAISRKVLGEEHPDTALSLNSMGSLLTDTGDLQAALPYHEKALVIGRKMLGEEHPYTALFLSNLGSLHQCMGDLQAALPYFEKALEIDRKMLGEEHPHTARALSKLGILHQCMGDLQAALPYYEKALEIDRKMLGEEHPYTALCLNNLGSLHQSMGDLKAALSYHEKALAIRIKVLGEEHPDTAISFMWMGSLLANSNNIDEARKHLQHAVKIFTSTLGLTNSTTQKCKTMLDELPLTSFELLKRLIFH